MGVVIAAFLLLSDDTQVQPVEPVRPPAAADSAEPSATTPPPPFPSSSTSLAAAGSGRSAGSEDGGPAAIDSGPSEEFAALDSGGSGALDGSEPVLVPVASPVLPAESVEDGSSGSKPEPAIEPASDFEVTGERAGGARQSDPVEPAAPEEADRTDSSGSARSSAQGEVYTWNDGDRTLQAQLQSDLVVLDDGAISTKDTIVAETSSGRIVARGTGGDGHTESTRGGHPVFASESGTLMTLPGGVVVALDPDWAVGVTDAFFARNSISLDRVSELDYLANGFFVETDPGFASLELANALAGQLGVEFSIPNWWRERTTR